MDATKAEEIVRRYEKMTGKILKKDDPLVPLYGVLFAIYDQKSSQENLSLSEERFKQIIEEVVRTKVSISIKEEGAHTIAEGVAEKLLPYLRDSLSSLCKDEKVAKRLERLENIIEKSQESTQENFWRTPIGVITVFLAFMNATLVLVLLFKG